MWDIEILYRAHKQAVFAYLMSLTRGDEESAEDLLSETFMQAMRSISSFRGESSVRTWLCGIARNLWLRQFRNAKTEVSLEEWLGGLPDQTGERLTAEELRARVQELLDERGEPARTVFRMRLRLCPYSEIAERLNLSESSARVLEFRTRKWLKQILTEEGLMENG